jgi:hypothetical protein
MGYAGVDGMCGRVRILQPRSHCAAIAFSDVTWCLNIASSFCIAA